MIAIPYQSGVVIGMSDAEKQAVWSYLRYSNYMFGRLYGLRDKHPPPTLETIFHILDASIRANLTRRVGLRYAQHSRRLMEDNVLNIAVSTRSANIPRINYHIALSPRIVTLFREWQFNHIRAAEALRQRLKREIFPEPSAWLTFVSALRGIPVNTYTMNPELSITYLAYQWNEVFPRIFPTFVSLEKWGKATEEILQCFARARRVSVATVGKLLRVKI